MMFSFLSAHDIWLLITAVLCTLFLLDDVFIDAMALFKKCKARKISSDEIKKMRALPQKKIAVLVASWREDEILERVVNGNIQQIEYSNYEFYLGVYPNDQKTLEAARRIEKRHKNVTVVVNTLNGPTSKGQMLNVLARYIGAYNADSNKIPFEMIVIQDAEDLIHKYSLKLMNMYMNDYDFLQTPVFSLNTPLSKLTAGIYIDEFIESHTKDLLVRNYYKAGLPSAGVGTALKWGLVRKLMQLQEGDFLNEKTLTEDYHLGLTCHDIGAKNHFACDFYEYKDEKTGEVLQDYIATREYFPQKAGLSIKQKTRWFIGITLQGFEERKWKSTHFSERYFLWRDRRGLVNAPLFTSAFVFLVYFVTTWLMTGNWPSLEYTPYNTAFVLLMYGNLLFSIFRICNRMRLVSSVYGLKMALLVPVRWIFSNFINTFSTYNAVFKWFNSKYRNQTMAWAKTEHMIPVGFGLENLIVLEAETLETPVQTSVSRENNQLTTEL